MTEWCQLQSSVASYAYLSDRSPKRRGTWRTLGSLSVLSTHRSGNRLLNSVAIPSDYTEVCWLVANDELKHIGLIGPSYRFPLTVAAKNFSETSDWINYVWNLLISDSQNVLHCVSIGLSHSSVKQMECQELIDLNFIIVVTRTWLRYVRVFAIVNPSVCL